MAAGLTDAEIFAHTPAESGVLRLSKASPPSLFTRFASAPSDALCAYRLPLGLTPEARAAFFRARAEGGLSAAEDRAIGAMLGMAVGDSLGAPFEFLPYRAGGVPPSTLGLHAAPLDEAMNAFGLKPGQWTDDASMGLCLADSLLATPGFAFSPLDLMLRFTGWWQLGYNNAFGDDAERGKGGGFTFRAARSSVGQGGIIGASMDAFLSNGLAFTQCGTDKSSGNGSIMRLAAAPVLHHSDEARAAELGRSQSRTTHRGTEAAECAALMATLIARAIHMGDPPSAPAAAAAAASAAASARKAALLDSLSTYACPQCPSVELLARSQAEPGDRDRDWNWRVLPAGAYRYAPGRAAAQPGYVGSYAMDALAMALHCVHATGSFGEAVCLAANMRGDSDTVAAVAGQIAGAVYGASAIPPAWVAAVEQWDGGGGIALRAHCLFARVPAAGAASASASAAAAAPEGGKAGE